MRDVSQKRLIALTGAESSGKTTLAMTLAKNLHAPLVAEASRDLLVPGQPYGVDDVLRIAREQVLRESEALRQHAGWIVADTDLLVIRIWLDERFDIWPDELEQLWTIQEPRLHVLTVPEMPWETDPLRENPDDRHRLHARYVEQLVALNCDWIEVGGSVAERESQVLDRLQR